MKTGNWQQVKDIFYSALEQAPAEREAFLDAACGADQDLRRDIEILLASYQSEFLEKPAAGRLDLAAMLEPQTVKIGTQINQYKIIKKIGTGGMGEVFLADDTRLHRQVAIKFFQSASVFGAQSERRLLREAQSAARLNHPNICTIYEIAESENGSFIVMEYINGETLEERMQREKPSIGESLQLVLSIADALTEAHAHGIVHRDIKPSNVMINPRGQVKVLDFSLAKKTFTETDETKPSFLSESGVIAGTIAYMSPEQARGQTIDSRSDIWSLGVVTYQLLTGSLPFQGETKSDSIAAILLSEPAPFSDRLVRLMPEAEQIIHRALAKDIEARYQTIQEFANRLRRLHAEFDLPRKARNLDGLLTERTTRKISKRRSAEAEDFDESTASTIALETDENKIPQRIDFFEGKAKSRKTVFFVVIFAALCAALVWQMPRLRTANKFPFTAASRADLQITSLFSIKRKLNGGISDISFSPDGNLIVFLLSGEGKSNVYVKQISGGEPVKITDGSWVDRNPVWSADGQRIAFVSNRENKSGIWTVPYLGGTPVLLLALDLNKAFYLLRKWSKDGRTIFYESRGNFYRLDLQSGESSTIYSSAGKDSSEFSVSDDEQMMAYVKIKNDKEQIWISPLSGEGEPQAITDNDHHNWSPVWFPDNQSLAFSSDQNGNFQIYIDNRKDSQPVQITFGDFNASMPVVSPDGLKIVYVSETDEANIYSFDLDTRKESVQTANIKMQLFPDISPNGQRISFQTTDDGAKIFNSPLKIQPVNRGDELLTINPDGGNAKWSPDGQSIAFLRLSGYQVHLWTMNIDDRKEQRLTSREVYRNGNTIAPYDLMSTVFSWSPNGDKIAFIAKVPKGYELCTVSKDGTDEQIISKNTEEMISPIWSADGSRIAFINTNVRQNAAEKTRRNVNIIEQGQTETVFQAEGQIRLLGWSRSDKEIFVAVTDGAEVVLFKVLTTSPNEKPKQIVKLAGAHLHGIRLSPDGGQIAFTARRDGNDNVFLVSAEGEEIRQLTANADATLYFSGLTWSPDGKTLYYSKQTGGVQISLISNSK